MIAVPLFLSGCENTILINDYCAIAEAIPNSHTNHQRTKEAVDVHNNTFERICVEGRRE